MAFSDKFIKRPVLTTVCSILIVLMGVIAIPTLPIANLPNIAPPLIQVTANYSGANSLVTEQSVTNPLEQQINGVPGASYISSTSNMEGQSIIQVYFDETTNIDIDQVNVQNRVSLAMPQLPSQVSATGVSVQQSTPSILLAYQVSSSDGQFDSAYLNGLIYEQLYYPLERIDGVANVNILGGSNPAYWLNVDPGKLAANNLTASQVIDAVQAQNTTAVGGLVGGPPASGNQAYTYPLLVIRSSWSWRAIDKFCPSTTRVVAIWDVPIRVFSFVTHRIDFIHIPVKDSDSVTIPIIEFNLCPRTKERDVATWFEYSIPFDATGRRTAVCDVI